MLKKKILITGATGFIRQQLLSYVNSRKKVKSDKEIINLIDKADRGGALSTIILAEVKALDHIKAKVIKASVKKENHPMIKIHRLCNFKEIDKENSIYYDYEFSINEYKAIPNNMEDFVTFLTNKYLDK